jgi:hypothetical protein
MPFIAQSSLELAYLVLGPIEITGPKIEGSAKPLTLKVYYTRLLPKGKYTTVNGACCSCCGTCASFVSPCLFGKFPNHGTHVQFFTKKLFEMYHGSGKVLGAKIVELLVLSALAPAPSTSAAPGSALLALPAPGSGAERSVLEMKR